MPRLICALPCENAIVSNDNKLSLISLIESLDIGMPVDAQIAPNTVIPMRWYAVCIFEREPADDDKEFYETHVELGNVQSTPARFKFNQGATFHRVLHILQGLPLVFGPMRLRTFGGLVGQAQKLIGEYPITIQRAAPPGSPPN